MKNIIFTLLLVTTSLTAQKADDLKKVIHTFKFQPNCIAINKSDTELLIGGENEKVIRFNLTNSKVIQEINAHYQPLANVKYSNIHDGFYTVGDRSFKLWMTGEEKPKIIYTGSHTNITDWATTPDEDVFVGGSYGKNFRFWVPSKNAEPTEIKTSQKKSVISVAVSNNKKTIAAGSLDSTIELWDIATQTRKLKILAHDQPVGCLEFIKGGKYLLSASHDGYAKLWDAETGNNIRVFNGQAQSINAISISPDNRFLLAGTWDGFICLFAISTGDLIYKFHHHKAPVWDLTWSNKGDGFYSCDKEGELVRWTVTKELVVNYYFSEDINNELKDNRLFAPKRKQESKDDYKTRQKKAMDFKQELIDRYYKQVLEMIVT
ncbi:WD40 repeat domain-containing protein [Labilibacter sediminis]|nr:WD40 repeat domain-containing protein [Labilibacter sediminis]